MQALYSMYLFLTLKILILQAALPKTLMALNWNFSSMESTDANC